MPDRSRSIIISEDYNHTGSPLQARQLTVNNNCRLSITNNLLVVTDSIHLEGEIRLIDTEIDTESGRATPIGQSQLITTHSNSTQVSGNGRLMVDQNSENPSTYRYTYMGTPVNTIGGSTYTIASVMKDGSTPTSTTSDITDMTFTASHDGSPTSPITISNRWIYTYGTSADWSQKEHWRHSTVRWVYHKRTRATTKLHLCRNSQRRVDSNNRRSQSGLFDRESLSFYNQCCEIYTRQS